MLKKIGLLATLMLAGTGCFLPSTNKHDTAVTEKTYQGEVELKKTVDVTEVERLKAELELKKMELEADLKKTKMRSDAIRAENKRKAAERAEQREIDIYNSISNNN